jgi:hypothetical protein
LFVHPWKAPCCAVSNRAVARLLSLNAGRRLCGARCCPCARRHLCSQCSLRCSYGAVCGARYQRLLVSPLASVCWAGRCCAVARLLGLCAGRRLCGARCCPCARRHLCSQCSLRCSYGAVRGARYQRLLVSPLASMCWVGSAGRHPPGARR